jgi:hypothetical protein
VSPPHCPTSAMEPWESYRPGLLLTYLGLQSIWGIDGVPNTDTLLFICSP